MTILDNSQTKPKYSFLGKFLHWSFLVLFAYGITKQVDDINQLEDISFLKSEIAFALVFLIFLTFRFFYMTKTQKTSLPAETHKAQRFAARLVHMSMYIALTGIACSGVLMGYFFWQGYKSGFLIKFMISIHEFFVALTYWLVCIHILAAIYHGLRRDGVWSSMIPSWKENSLKK